MIGYKNNQLTIEGILIEELAKNRPTPFYIYSWNQVERNVNKVKEVFQGTDYHISFAAKANNNLYLLEAFKNMGIGIDIVSKGEFEAVKTVGFKNKDVIVNGNGKTRAFLKEIVEFQPKSLNIDSNEEMERLEEVVTECGEKVRAALRINPDVDPITHPYISTGLKKNKFGIDMVTAKQLIKKYADHPFIQIQGLHVHIGSQLLYVSPYEDAYQKVYDFIQSLDKHNLHFINIGGGWGIDYERNGNEFPLNEYKEKVIPILKKINLEIILELGRFLIGNAGVLVGKVEYVKKTPYNTFVVTDASMADLIRPSLYNGYHHIYTQFNTGREINADVVGPVCESGDRLAENRKLKIPHNGEYIAICDTGAYGYSMSSNYNFSLRSAEFLLKDGCIKEIRPREEIKELIRYYEQGNVSEQSTAEIN